MLKTCRVALVALALSAVGVTAAISGYDVDYASGNTHYTPAMEAKFPNAF